MAALRTEHLQCMLKCLVANPTTDVLGAFPADQVPAVAEQCVITPHHHHCYILNTDPSTQPGEHWVAFFYNNDANVLEYFDSFGMPLITYTHVHTALNSRNLIPLCAEVNHVGMLQSLQSTVCGHYCVMYLYWRARHSNLPMHQFASKIALRETSAVRRDAYVVCQLRALIQRCRCDCEHPTPTTAINNAVCSSQTCTCCKRHNN